MTAQSYLRVTVGVAFLGESVSPAALPGLTCVIVGVAAMLVTEQA